jgi:hypothetical protein
MIIPKTSNSTANCHKLWFHPIFNRWVPIIVVKYLYLWKWFILIVKNLLKYYAINIIKNNVKYDIDLNYENSIYFTWNNHVK